VARRIDQTHQKALLSSRAARAARCSSPRHPVQKREKILFKGLARRSTSYMGMVEDEYYPHSIARPRNRLVENPWYSHCLARTS
jgi:hypothetical protein